jgi:hypothetical protein
MRRAKRSAKAVGEFLLAEDPKEQAIQESEWVIGSEEFRRRLKRPASRPVPRRSGRPPRQEGSLGPVYPQHPRIKGLTKLSPRTKDQGTRRRLRLQDEGRGRPVQNH